MNRNNSLPNVVRLDVLNFGPINKGTVFLDDLIVFIGQNETGKSYTALLFRILLDVFSRIAGPIGVLEKRLSTMGQLTLDQFEALDASRAFETVISEGLSGKGVEPVAVDPRICWDMVETIRLEYENALQREMEEWFQSKSYELIREGSKAFRLTLTYGDVSWHIRGLSSAMKIALKSPVPVLEFSSHNGGITCTASIEGRTEVATDEDFRHLYNPTLGVDKSRIPYLVALTALARVLSLGTIGRLLFLPAGRAGALSNEMFLYEVLLRYQDRYFSPSRALRMLLLDVLRARSRVSELAGMVADAERSILKGRFIAPSDSKPEELKYRVGTRDFSLSRAASSVSELAPILLTAKTLWEENDLVIIEEPEAHLSPSNQVAITRLLARAVNKGVKMLVTTHSDFILGQIGLHMNLHKEGKIPPKRGYSEQDSLSNRSVGVYLFKEETEGTVVTKLDSSNASAWQREFAEVHRTLYRDRLFTERSDS